jgi:predicted dehydrogenase
LNKGKHVFCEKPPGRNLKETELMIEAEKGNSKCKLMFGFNHRHHESLIHAKEVINSGRLGKILWMRGRYGKSVQEGFCNSWRAKKELAGGGIFLDQGIHMLDLFLMMVEDFDEVKSYVSNLYWDLDIEDNVFAIFKNRKGQVASLHSTMTQWRHLFSFEIFLEKGHVVINGLLTTSGSYGQEELSIAEIFKEGPSASWDKEEKRKYNINTSWDNEIKMFFKAIQKNTAIPVGNSDDAYKLMCLVDKVYKEGG